MSIPHPDNGWGSAYEVMEVILEHGLAIRQIPREIWSTHEIRHKKDGDEEFWFENTRWPHTSRMMIRRRRVPKHPGWWMCQKYESTSSTMTWDFKRHNLAPTLVESVTLFLEGLRREQEST